MTSTLVKVVV